MRYWIVFLGILHIFVFIKSVLLLQWQENLTNSYRIAKFGDVIRQ